MLLPKICLDIACFASVYISTHWCENGVSLAKHEKIKIVSAEAKQIQALLSPMAVS